MKPRTYQDHIDPLVIKVQKCYAPGHTNGEIQVLFQIAGYTKQEFPVVVCSSGHGLDLDNIPNLRRPEDDPVAWVKANAMDVVRNLPIELCHAHSDGAIFDNDNWGQDGHLWKDGNIQELKLCQPQA